MWWLDQASPAEAMRVLVVSGGAAILWSSLLGFGMLVPMQPWARGWAGKPNVKPVGSAHLDWIMLALMLGLAAQVLVAFEVRVSWTAIIALAAGAWLNPLPYVFRAFGVNAFVLGGPPRQVAAASLGFASSVGIIYGWTAILIAVAWG
ncbi:MAG: hypothetical protein ACFB9M_21370 [Myxococcota bacterium]